MERTTVTLETERAKWPNPAATCVNTTRYYKYSLVLLMMDENIARDM
jgi:hypothetical protein